MRILPSALFGFSLCTAMHAQFSVPNVIQQGRRTIEQQRQQQQQGQQPATARNQRTPSVSPEKCQALVQWIAILPREEPKVDFMHTAMGPKMYEKVVNLFRDEYFQPLYGRPFSQTTAEERLAFHKTVFRPCMAPGMVSASDAGLLRYETIVGRPFTFARTADFSADYVIAGLAQRQSVIAWAQQVRQNLGQVPPTSEGFDQLDKDFKRGQTDLEKLWPREKQAFIDAVKNRQSVMARAILDNVNVTASKEAPKGFEGTKTITELYRGQDRYLKLLDPESRQQVQKQKDEALSAALQSAVTQERQKLASFPVGLKGAVALNAWSKSFEGNLQGLPPSAEAQKLVADAAEKRQQLLVAGLPEFKTTVQNPKASGSTDASALMNQLFPDERDATLPEYQQYQAILSARLEAVAKEASAKCDKLAALPTDPEAVAKGVSDALLNAPAVIAACEPAAKLDNAPGRVHFQLARGYLKADRVEDAIEPLIAAAKQGHGAALAYLGDIHLDGAPGIDPDPALAYSLYERAVEAGFAPAKAVLAKFENYTDKAAAVDEEEGQGTEAEATALPPITANTKYLHPEIVDNIQQGKLDAVPTGEVYTKGYLLQMAENIGAVCEEQAYFTKRDLQQLQLDGALTIVDLTPTGGLNALLGGLQAYAQIVQNPEASIRRMAAVERDQGDMPEEAMKDAFAFMTRHVCGTPEIVQFNKNLVAYIRNVGAPRVPSEEMYRTCQSYAQPTGRYNAANFCTCFMPALANAPVSRADRKALSSSFWPTAKRLMASDPSAYSLCTAR